MAKPEFDPSGPRDWVAHPPRPNQNSHSMYADISLINDELNENVQGTEVHQIH